VLASTLTSCQDQLLDGHNYPWTHRAIPQYCCSYFDTAAMYKLSLPTNEHRECWKLFADRCYARCSVLAFVAADCTISVQRCLLYMQYMCHCCSQQGTACLCAQCYSCTGCTTSTCDLQFHRCEIQRDASNSAGILSQWCKYDAMKSLSRSTSVMVAVSPQLQIALLCTIISSVPGCCYCHSPY
jgi:hypothetical protein